MSEPGRARPFSILRFSALVLGVFALINAPWFGLRDLYATAFRLLGTISFAPLGFGYNVHFQPSPPGAAGDTVVSILSPLSSHGWFIACDSALGRVVVAAFTALVVATPLPPRRKLRAWGVGFALIQLFVVLRLGLIFLEGFGVHTTQCPLPHEGFLARASTFRFLGRLNRELVMDLVGVFLPAVLVWILVALRDGDWRLFLRGEARAL